MIPVVEGLANSFATAYADIRQLLARDCWPRFMLSRFYPAYQKLIKEEVELSSVVTGLTKSAYQPQSRDSGAEAQRSRRGSSKGDGHWELASAVGVSEISGMNSSKLNISELNRDSNDENDDDFL